METASVVVPAREEWTTLPRTLDSLADQDCRLALEVIAVAGDERTGRVARDHPVVDRVVDDGQCNGPGKARNRGAAAATGDLLLFTDADTVVPPDWVRSHRRHYATPDVVGVGGPLRPLADEVHHRVLFKLLSDWWYRASWPLGFVQQSGNNCSVRSRAFDAIGGFDESLAFLEDTDLSLRLSERGHVVYDERCPVWTSPRRQEREGYGRLFCAYLAGYVAYAVPGVEPGGDYF
ncbi:glycosyltransferase [Halobacteria archaeon AArc-m2/3/4]|uniref:Glycosyltransferase n=1 Tax=Natronoglomus mannanivorans TaxID=2979990 RepID=A0ABT2QHQ9_9EURY|nr:glycosyltransferase [Halobacteria archaeon AArc-m2/3/4]